MKAPHSQVSPGAAGRATGWGVRLLFAATIFLGAFLLFQVQPIMGKSVLPWFGGSGMVWVTTLMFFQVGLLGGYAYAHGVAGRMRPGTQAVVHGLMMGVTLFALPVIPSASLRPDGAGIPSLDILIVLAATVGGPYLVLSSTGPLLQHWYSRLCPDRSPYRLYALSNAASLLALLSYPFLFERVAGLRSQVWLWSGAYGVFALLTAAIALRVWGGRHGLALPSKDDEPGDDTARAPEDRTRGRGAGTALLWVALPAAASAMMMSVTNAITRDVASVPLLWVPPLAIYLLSLTLTFDRPGWYRRRVFLPLLVPALAGITMLLPMNGGLDFPVIAGVFCGALFVITMVLHGELSRLTPAPRDLTSFYLAVAAGGALGGFFVALLAPALFNGFWEMHVGLVASALLTLVAVLRPSHGSPAGGGVAIHRLRVPAAVTAGVAIAGMSGVLVGQIVHDLDGAVAVDRSFHGVLRVLEAGDPSTPGHHRVLKHGGIDHGEQFQAPDMRSWPTTYYAPASGVALAIQHHPSRLAALPDKLSTSDNGLSIGAVGLGAGTVAAYLGPDDAITFYEVDPLVAIFALDYFSYLGDAAARGADVEIRFGDARLVMEDEAASPAPPRYDLIIVDAFTGDAIPLHLLTEEAAHVYRDLLAPGGILAFHISNRHLELERVMRGLALALEMEAVRVVVGSDSTVGQQSSTWVLLTDDGDFVEDPVVDLARVPWDAEAPAPVLWTDDRSNLMDVLYWERG